MRLSATSKNQDWFQTNVSEVKSALPQWADLISRQTTRSLSRITAITNVESDSDSEDLEDEDLEEEATNIQVYPYRFRLWDLVASPGGGSTAVLASRHSTQHPRRQGVSRLYFASSAGKSTGTRSHNKTLTTEGQMWEWMYGSAAEVPGATSQHMVDPRLPNSRLHEMFKEVIPRQDCVFCDAKLTNNGSEAMCQNGHSFGMVTSDASLSSE